MKQELFNIRSIAIQNSNDQFFPVEDRGGPGDAWAASKLEETEGILFLGIEGGFRRCNSESGEQMEVCMQDGIQLTLDVPGGRPFMAIYQFSEWWLRPTFGSRLEEIPSRSQLLIFREDGEEQAFTAFLAICGEQGRTDMRGFADGIRVTLSSNLGGQLSQGGLLLAAGRGRDPYILLEKMTELALKKSGKLLKSRKKKQLPEVFKGLGWCSWDSMGQSVNEKDILRKMEEFRELHVPLQWVLIDDGWSDADMDTHKLMAFEADKEKFPHGLSETVRILKEHYGIRYVGVWQAVKGYWNGISEESPLAESLSFLLKKWPDGELAPAPEAGSVFCFWNLWHRYLCGCDVDFVKVDSQSALSSLARGTSGYTEMASVYHDGLEASAALNFDGALINCMGMAPEDVWNRHQAVLSRNSDDYMPRIPESFTEHALENGYNSVYHGNFYWEDWDMVWSGHEYTRKNLILRAISGGPVYLSDAYGETDPENVLPLITETGEVLRCEDVGRPTLDCLVRNPVEEGGVLKLYNRCGNTVLIAAFSFGEDTKTVWGSIDSADIPGEMEGHFLIYDVGRRKAVSCGKGSPFTFSLKGGEAAMFELLPGMTRKDAGEMKEQRRIQVIGAVDKLLPAAAIREYRVWEHGCFFIARCAGDYAFTAECIPRQIFVEGVSAEAMQEDGFYRIPDVSANASVMVFL